MKRVSRFAALLVAIPAALIAIIGQTVFGGGGMGGARGGFMDPAARPPSLSTGGGAASVDPRASIRAVVTDLSAEQNSKLAAAEEEMSTKLAEWQDTSRAALQAVATQPGAGQGSEKYAAEQYKQNLLREEIINDAEIKMVGILTDAQAEKWAAARLNALVNARLGSLGWSEEQKAKVVPLIAETAKKLAAVKDTAALVKTEAEFWSKVYGMLTEEQVKQLFVPTFPAGRGGVMGGMGGMGGAMGGRGRGD